MFVLLTLRLVWSDDHLPPTYKNNINNNNNEDEMSTSGIFQTVLQTWTVTRITHKLWGIRNKRTYLGNVYVLELYGAASIDIYRRRRRRRRGGKKYSG